MKNYQQITKPLDKKIYSLALALLLLFTYLKGSSQTLVTYTGMGAITCPASPTATIAPAVTGLTFSQITRGSGVTCSSLSSGITGTGFNTTLAAAISGSKWYTFDISSNASTAFTLNSLSIITQVSNATGTPTMSVQYSIDGGAKAVLGSITLTATGTTYTITPTSTLSVGASHVLSIFLIPNGLTASSTTCRITNGSGANVTASSAAAPVITSPLATTGNVGTPFSYTITASNSPTSLYTTNPPAPFTGSAVITGTPTAVGTYSFAISAANAIGTDNQTMVLTVSPGAQTLSGLATTDTKTYGDAAYALNATATSGLGVSYSSSNTSVASILGNTVTINGAGTTTITASQGGDANWNAATNATQTLTVNKATQTITFNALPAKFSNDAPFTLNATSATSAINPITFSSSNPAVADVVGNVVTIYSAGTTNITASQAANANYNAATNVVQAQLINLAGLQTQTITFNTLPTATYEDGPITLITNSSAGLPITYTSSNLNVASTSGNQLTIVGPGTATITASQAGNGSYYPASSVNQSLLVNVKNLTVVGAVAQNKVFDGTAVATIDLSGVNLSSQLVGTDVVTVTGTAGTFASVNVATGIPVTSNITLVGADATKYSLNTQPTLSAAITPATQTIVFGTLTAKTFGTAPYTISATGGNSTSPVTFTSDNNLVATVSGNTVTIVGAGTANITASQAGDANYSAASDVVQLLTVNKAFQTITFAVLPSKVIGDAPFALTATGGGSGNPITYTSSAPTVADVIGNTVSIYSVGNTDITASQAGNANYNAATSVVRNLVVNYPTLVAWDMNPLPGGANAFGVSPYAASITNSAVTASGLIRGTGVGTTATAAARGWGGVAWNNATATANIAANKFITFTIQPTSGNKVTFASINPFYYRRSSTGATNALVQYSLDGTTFTDITTVAFTNTSSTGANIGLIDLTSIPALQNLNALTNVTFRLIPYGATGTTGTLYIYDVVNSTAVDFGVNGIITPCTPTSSTQNLNVCPANLPYTWNSQILTTAGTYTFSATNATGCDSVSTLILTTNSCASVVNLKCFIEGYYLGSGVMTPTLMNEGVGSSITNVDEITVTLKDALTFATIATTTAMLHTDGTATATFPTAPNGLYFIAVSHRNALETWSVTAQLVGATPLNYDFTTASTQAYTDGSSNNMREIEPGVWAFWSGDIFKDGSIDGSDGSALDNDSDAGAFGYFATDLNGDGSIDGSDYPFFNNNADASIYSQHP